MNEAQMGGVPAPAKKSGHGGWIINLIIIIIVVAVILYLISAYTSLNILGVNKSDSGDANTWKAIFLTNGQVYFGHTADENADPVVLEEIYYLQVIQPLQQLGADQPAPNLNQPQLSLVKLGNELHGPSDQMRINREHVLFVEDLKDDGRVVEAINEYVASQETE